MTQKIYLHNKYPHHLNEPEVLSAVSNSVQENLDALSVCQTLPFMVEINGEFYSKEEQQTFETEEDIHIHIMPMGIGAALTNFISGAILGVSSAAAAKVVGVGLAYTAISVATTLVVLYGASLLFSALFKPDLPGQGSSKNGSPTYSFGNRRNSIRNGEAIPVLYGQHLVVPDVISQPYRRYIDNEEYIYTYLLVTQGEADILKYQFGNEEASSFPEVQIHKYEPNDQIISTEPLATDGLSVAVNIDVSYTGSSEGGATLSITPNDELFELPPTPEPVDGEDPVEPTLKTRAINSFIMNMTGTIESDPSAGIGTNGSYSYNCRTEEVGNKAGSTRRVCDTAYYIDKTFEIAEDITAKANVRYVITLADGTTETQHDTIPIIIKTNAKNIRISRSSRGASSPFVDGDTRQIDFEAIELAVPFPSKTFTQIEVQSISITYDAATPAITKDLSVSINQINLASVDTPDFSIYTNPTVTNIELTDTFHGGPNGYTTTPPYFDIGNYLEADITSGQGGLGYLETGGDVSGIAAEVIFETIYTYLDTNNNPQEGKVEETFTISSDSETSRDQQFRSFILGANDPNRARWTKAQVRVKRGRTRWNGNRGNRYFRGDEGTTTRYLNDVFITGLKAKFKRPDITSESGIRIKRDPFFSFDATILSIRARASENMTASVFGQFNVIAERRLYRQYDDKGKGTGSLVKTRNPIWAVLDILSNERYGAGKNIRQLTDYNDLVQLAYKIERMPLTERPNFDYVFDGRTTRDKAVEYAMKVIRGTAYLHDGLLRVSVDEGLDMSPVTTFTAEDIVQGSFSLKTEFDNGENNDGVRVQYVDSTRNYTPFTIDFSPSIPEGDEETLANNPILIDLNGVTDANRAQSLGRYLYQTDQHARTFISFKTPCSEVITMTHGDLFNFEYSGSVIEAPVLFGITDVVPDIPLDVDPTGVYTLTVNGASEVKNGTHQTIIRVNGEDISTTTTVHNGDVIISDLEALKKIRELDLSQAEVHFFIMGEVRTQLARFISSKPEKGDRVYEVLALLTSPKIYEGL